MKGNLFIKSVLACAMMQASISHSGAFHTIIGPDGHPMVVQMPDRDRQKKSADKKADETHAALRPIDAQAKQPAPAVLPDVKAPEHISAVQEQNLQTVISGLAPSRVNAAAAQPKVKPVEKAEKIEKPKAEKAVVSPAQPINAHSSVQINEPIEISQQGISVKRDVQPALQKNILDGTAEQQSISVRPAHPVEIPPAVMQSIQKNEELNKANSPFKVLPPELVKKKPAEPLAQSAETRTGFSAMNGEQYVNSEYLEDHEFNLEGKKRFYAMPEGVIDNKIGATRMQMVEREKGVSKSILESLFKHNQPVVQGPVALSASYYRVSQADAAASLDQQCFQEKQFKSAKHLKSGSETNVWPRAPLKDEFDFEVIKVEPSIQNIQINSYASKQNHPTFYWPFVVFLDAKGCVLEGAGGFKNKDGGEDHLRRERIEGVIQIPKKTEYLLLTPLATALDVEQRALANYGQLKLIAIR